MDCNTINVNEIDFKDASNDLASERCNAIKSAVQHNRSKRSLKLPIFTIKKRRPRLIIKEVNNWNLPSMDSGDGGNYPDTVVETVARENTAVTENAQVLPEIRAAPCPIHIKRHEIYGAFSTDIRSPRRQTHLQLAHQTNNIPSQQTQGEGKTINVRIQEQCPTKPPPVLPRNMSSKDYVMSWLVHGSDPLESNHFPEIIPHPIKTKNRNHHSKSKSRLARASIVE